MNRLAKAGSATNAEFWKCGVFCFIVQKRNAPSCDSNDFLIPPCAVLDGN